MPQRLVILITYFKTFLAPLIGWGSLMAFLQIDELYGKPLYVIIGTIILAFFTYLGVRANARTRVEVVEVESKVKAIEVTESADVNKVNIALQIFDRAVQEAEKARTHFSEQLKEQREHFSNELREYRDHYEEKEKRLREDYHDRLTAGTNLYNKTQTRLLKIELGLRTLGIEVDENAEINLPASFERRKN